jgi:hypothetical protein
VIAPDTIHLVDPLVARTLLERMDQMDDDEDDWDEDSEPDPGRSEELSAKRELLARRAAGAARSRR